MILLTTLHALAPLAALVHAAAQGDAESLAVVRDELLETNPIFEGWDVTNFEAFVRILDESYQLPRCPACRSYLGYDLHKRERPHCLACRTRSTIEVAGGNATSPALVLSNGPADEWSLGSWKMYEPKHFPSATVARALTTPPRKPASRMLPVRAPARRQGRGR